MEPLPSYHDIDSQVTTDDVPRDPSDSVIGGSGGRIPLSHGQRAQFDRQTVARLKAYGSLACVNVAYPVNSPHRHHTFNPDVFYQSAVSQLDRILPALSSPTPPATTALRTITLRIKLPPPDVDWIAEVRTTGLIEGRLVLKRALRSWISFLVPKKGGEALFEAVDAVVARVLIEGFLVLEEWWDLRSGLCMLTVRC